MESTESRRAPPACAVGGVCRRDTCTSCRRGAAVLASGDVPNAAVGEGAGAAQPGCAVGLPHAGVSLRAPHAAAGLRARGGGISPWSKPKLGGALPPPALADSGLFAGDRPRDTERAVEGVTPMSSDSSSWEGTTSSCTSSTSSSIPGDSTLRGRTPDLLVTVWCGMLCGRASSERPPMSSWAVLKLRLRLWLWLRALATADCSTDKSKSSPSSPARLWPSSCFPSWLPPPRPSAPPPRPAGARGGLVASACGLDPPF